MSLLKCWYIFKYNFFFISENYVYDLYTVEKDGDTKMDDIQADFPL